MIKKVKIELLNPAAYNPRVALQKGDEEYQKIEKSIDEFGYIVPIVWNERTGNVVGGHQRLQVLKDKGEKEIEVSVVNLNKADEKQLNVALNKIKGDWDYDKLSKLLQEFDVEELDVTGFTADELSVILAEDDIGDFDDDFDWDFEPLGQSFVLTLKFANISSAEKWASENGYEDQIKEGTSTTVIRV